MKPKVSIIVPIYNVEKYLNQCVDSLLMQTLEDIEIILIDDGSPDKSGEFADSYAQKDKRIKVIHQENAGLGPARNSGMDIATGEYIGFVDSDDWVKPEMYERLYNEAVRTHADIVVSGHCEFSGEKILKICVHPLAGKTLSNKNDIHQIRKNLYARGVDDRSTDAFPMSACTAIYRRELLTNCNIVFQNILSEDRIFNLYAYYDAKTISFLKHTDYFYRKEGQSSITQTFSLKKKEQFQELLINTIKMAETEKDKECIMRVKRMAIDYCRSYVAAIGKTKLGFSDQVECVRSFFDTKAITDCWDGYPIEKLPIQQYIFHLSIKKRWYRMTVILNWFRQIIRTVYK